MLQKAFSSKKGAWVRAIRTAVATLQTLLQHIIIHYSTKSFTCPTNAHKLL